MASILSRVYEVISSQGNKLLKAFFFRYPPENYLPAILNAPCQDHSSYKPVNLVELLKESVLWAVPKKRRSVEKRRCRKFGIPKYFYKPLIPKTNILVCPKCGSYREAGLLCPRCYAKVKEETEIMQDAIKEHLGISPVESEVVVLYQDDERQNPEFYHGKRIVELKKDRPKLFSDNLLQKSTQGIATTKEVIEKK